MIRSAALSICLVLTAHQAKAQDSFVPVGLKSSCEFIYSRRCVAKGDRVRVKIVRVYVPYRVYRPEEIPGYRYVSECKK